MKVNNHNYDLQNHPEVRKWMGKLGTITDFKDFVSFMSPFQDNRTKLRAIFGKRNGTFKGEFLYSIWEVPFRGRTYQIFSAESMGTSYELVMKKDETLQSVSKNTKLGDDMVAFMKFISKKITGAKP